MALVGRPPCAPLAPYVKWLWLADGFTPGPHRQERILPTGEAALIVDLRDGAAGVSGPQSRSFVLNVTAQFAVAGVQFGAGGAFPFFDFPIGELANRHVALDLVWGRLAGELRERVLAAGSPDRRLDAIEHVLLGRLSAARVPRPAVIHAVRRLEYGTSVAALVSELGTSHRRFLDVFTAQVGLTPKLFGRVRRFQRVLQQVRAGRPVEWAHVALSCGYYDQAHFIRDFTEFSGVNPTTYRSTAGPHANHVPL